jgi:hypothetical protein
MSGSVIQLLDGTYQATEEGCASQAGTKAVLALEHNEAQRRQAKDALGWTQTSGHGFLGCRQCWRARLTAGNKESGRLSRQRLH